MLRFLALSSTAVAVIAMAIAAPGASAADPGGDAATAAKKRCADLVAFYDRWGATRSEHTDGARDHTRIGAAIDCERGHYEAGIAEMEALLVAKKFEVPVDVGEAPIYFPNEHVAEAAVR